tara:strand:- start:171 stop:413 length:243 start_codon:yes stop_codon:yes gene_type:complete
LVGVPIRKIEKEIRYNNSMSKISKVMVNQIEGLIYQEYEEQILDIFALALADLQIEEGFEAEDVIEYFKYKFEKVAAEDK